MCMVLTSEDAIDLIKAPSVPKRAGAKTKVECAAQC